MGEESASGSINNDQGQSPSCGVCGRFIIPEPDRAPLCDECRERLIKYPIPKKIIIPSIIVLIFVAALTIMRFPNAIKAGIYYERGIRAIKAGNYVTAENNLRNDYMMYLNSPEIDANYAIALYENEKTDEALQLFDKMSSQDMEIQDDALYQRLMGISKEVGVMYNVPDDFNDFYVRVSKLDANQMRSELEKYVTENPDCNYAKLLLADSFYDAKDYSRSEQVVNELIKAIPDDIPIQMLLAAIKRETGDFDTAEKICLQQLEKNHESVYVLSSLSRLELKRFQDKKSLEYMKQAYRIDPDDFNTMLDLARSYYYNNMRSELDALMAQIDSSPDKSVYVVQYNQLKDIIDGKTKWR